MMKELTGGFPLLAKANVEHSMAELGTLADIGMIKYPQKENPKVVLNTSS